MPAPGGPLLLGRLLLAAELDDLQLARDDPLDTSGFAPETFKLEVD